MPLTREERWLAKTLFENRVLKTHGDSFQDLFWLVMKAKHGSEFVVVRPQGSLGDGGNDGYLPSEGHYFQVYGPIDPSDKVQTAAKKLADDFEKLRREWGRSSPIKTYSFVFNDHYHGVFREIAQALADLEKAYSIPCRPFVAKDLEDMFVELDESAIDDVLGFVLPSSKISRPQFDVLDEVVRRILESPTAAIETRFGELPDVDEKIRLNHLSSPWADIVRSACRQVGHVDEFFRRNSRFVRQQLRDHLVDRYQRAKTWAAEQTFPNGLADAVFTEFRSMLLPATANLAQQQAVDILIGYYFEACDVFDPFAATEAASASPR